MSKFFLLNRYLIWINLLLLTTSIRLYGEDELLAVN